MKVASEKLGEDVVLVKINGRVVGDDSLKLREELKKQVDNFGKKKPKIIVDLENVSIMDSSALLGLVSIWTSVSKKGGRLVLLKLNKGIKNLIAITKLKSTMDVYESLELAQSSFEVST